jgi:hypothetical protein
MILSGACSQEGATEPLFIASEALKALDDPFGLLLINDIDAPGVPLVFVMFALLSAGAAERSGFSNDGTGSQKDRQALRRRTVVRKRK